MARTLRNITFVYVPREDRILAAINAGLPQPWSCWLTRRLSLAVLERTADYVASSSNVAQRAPAEFRSEAVAFEREAAIAKTAPAMSVTPPAVLQSNVTGAALADRLTIARHGDGYRFDLLGPTGEGATGLVKRDELQRILQMLRIEVGKAGWLATPSRPQAAPAAAAPATKPARH